jgi:hypothetical protein
VDTQYYLPLSGFTPPSASQPYGGASVIGSGYVQYVISSGISGTPTAPSWATSIGSTTSDNNIIWYCDAKYSPNSLSWTKGYVYAYSYASRLANDSYNTSVPPGANPAVPLGTPTGSELGDISTASPVYTIIGSNSGAVNTISGLGSTNPAVDTIIIWRSADGGGSSNMFFLTEIPNPTPIGGIAQPWTFVDYLPDLPTNLYPGLDNLEPAPIDDENNPPPAAFLPMIYNFSRIWGAYGNTVGFSGGPDVITGNPNSAFNPADEFPFLANVVRIVRTSQGAIVFTTDEIDIIAGGPATSSFYQLSIVSGIGLSSYNALDTYAGEIYFFSSDSEFKTLNASLKLDNYGFPVGDVFATWNAANVYVACQQVGVDNGIFVADGATGWWRCNPYQIPGFAGPEPIWSPPAAITGGCQLVQSIEITPGIKKLLVGGTGPNQQILERNLSVFTDNGTAYDAYFVMGSIVLAHPGQLAVLKFIEMDMSGVAYQPTVSFLLNEISGTFTPFTAAPQFDPPTIYGATLSPTSYSPNRYYFSGTQAVARCRHLQIKVDLGTTSNPDEVYNLTIFGRLLTEF